MWKAAKNGIVEFDFVNLRDFGLGPHKSVDDTPYGGGDGMLMRVEPIYAAIESVKEKDPSAEVILPTPGGETWTQELARQFAGIDKPDMSVEALEESIGKTKSGGKENVAGPRAKKHYIIFCPHYEGYDERILPLIDHKISLGNYVLTGGELPALIIIDSIVRLLPGVLGGDTSASVESFSDGNNIEFPQYTKPAEFRGMKVPDVLLSGDHGKVAAWRKSHEKRK
ncbi:tRNA (guanosine(37)-N1)-methyltransferase TrmD [Candidatus Saccharibacteria bacterium]|nr:tRNA (guanosine(37)-N1)-methyltransferase TrmD [Candidatus Saccharibacteria bacterium]